MLRCAATREKLRLRLGVPPEDEDFIPFELAVRLSDKQRKLLILAFARHKALRCKLKRLAQRSNGL